MWIWFIVLTTVFVTKTGKKCVTKWGYGNFWVKIVEIGKYKHKLRKVRNNGQMGNNCDKMVESEQKKWKLGKSDKNMEKFGKQFGLI